MRVFRHRPSHRAALRRASNCARFVAMSCAALLPAAALQAAPTKAVRVAVYDFTATDVPPAVVQVVTEAVTEEVRKLEGVAVVSMGEIRAMLDLEAQKQLTGCSDQSCLAEIAEAVGVDVLVVGSLARVGNERVFLLRRIDQRAAATTGSFQARVGADDDDATLALIGTAVAQTFADRALRPGTERGVSARVSARLHPPPLPPAVPTALFATSGALVVTAGIAAALAVGAVGAFDDYKNDPTHVTAYDLREHNRLADTAQLWTTAALATGGTALAALASALVSVAFTDFNGPPVQKEEPR